MSTFMNAVPAAVEGEAIWNAGKPSNLRMARRLRSVSITAPARPRSVGLLRRRACVLFSEWAMSVDEQSTAALVISELLTNAVQHGRDEMTLVVVRTGFALGITVVDHGEAAETAAGGDPDEHGRGLAIVTAVARDVCIDETATGWRTLARMDLDRYCPALEAEPSDARLKTAQREYLG